ncbi:hypothetical protein SUGI_1081770 [Cryptomeria japonica]|nr:hypothetical protein SUGI_1081770 [Cryptomeria japonica]
MCSTCFYKAIIIPASVETEENSQIMCPKRCFDGHMLHLIVVLQLLKRSRQVWQLLSACSITCFKTGCESSAAKTEMPSQLNYIMSNSHMVKPTWRM